MKQRILIVEDDLINREVLAFWVRKIGNFEIQEATNGREALEIITSDPPDCILMDLRMPWLDGWQATRQIRAQEVGRHIPIIAVTACAMVGDEERALAAGCDAYIAKPIMHHNQLAERIAPFLLTGLSGDLGRRLRLYH